MAIISTTKFSIEATPQMLILCPACLHASESAGPLRSGIFHCNECGARLVYGAVAPLVTVERADVNGRQFVCVRTRDLQTNGVDSCVTMDREHALSLASDILNMVKQ